MYVGEDSKSWSYSTMGYWYHNETSFEYGQEVSKNFQVEVKIDKTQGTVSFATISPKTKAKVHHKMAYSGSHFKHSVFFPAITLTKRGDSVFTTHEFKT